MPTKSANLVATGAREKVDIIYLQGLHAKRAFHRVFLCVRTARHLHVYQTAAKVYNNLREKEVQHRELKQNFDDLHKKNIYILYLTIKNQLSKKKILTRQLMLTSLKGFQEGLLKTFTSG